MKKGGPGCPGRLLLASLESFVLPQFFFSGQVFRPISG